MNLVPRLVCLAVVCLSVALSASPAAADGCKMPEVAFATMPEIPAQRAMIVWKDGVETLVVETAFTTASPTVGWVLPLPAEPQTLAPADPDMLTSLEMTSGPNLSDPYASWPSCAVWGLIFIAPVCLIFVVSKTSLNDVRAVILWVFIFVFIAAFWLPTLGGKVKSAAFGGAGVSGVEVTSVQRIGSYEAAVLRADTAAALSDWLAANKLKSLDDAGQRIVDDYIARKWCFVVARHAGGEGRTATAHPIAATFRAERPVYPMKLTALAGSTTRVDLFVAADDGMYAPGFGIIVSNHVRRSMDSEPEGATQAQPWYNGFPAAIGHPDAAALLGDRESWVLTHLQADLSPEEMDEDVVLSGFPLSGYIWWHPLTDAACRSLALTILGLGGIVVAILAGIVFARRRRPRKWQVVVLVSAAALVLVAAAVVEFLVPAVPVRTARVPMQYHYAGRGYGILPSVVAVIKEATVRPDMTDEEIISVLEKNEDLRDSLTGANAFTGRPVEAARTPGNYSIRREEGRTFFCVYDNEGREYRSELKAPQKQGTPVTPDAPHSGDTKTMEAL